MQAKPTDLTAVMRHDASTLPKAGAERIAALAARVMHTPFAVVCLSELEPVCVGLDCDVELDGEFFNATFGAATWATEQPLIVTDATLHSLFRANRLVTAAPMLRFVAGVRLRTADDVCIGTLCVADQVPRTPNPDQLAALQELASLLVSMWSLQCRSDADSVTGSLTRRCLVREAERAVALSARAGTDLACISLGIDRFRLIEAAHGQALGERILQKVASTCQSQIRAMDLFGRLGGAEFSIVLPQCRMGDALVTAERLRQSISLLADEFGATPIPVTASFGITSLSQRHVTLETLLVEADAALYYAQSEGSDRIVVSPAAGPGPWPETTPVIAPAKRWGG